MISRTSGSVSDNFQLYKTTGHAVAGNLFLTFPQGDRYSADTWWNPKKTRKEKCHVKKTFARKLLLGVACITVLAGCIRQGWIRTYIDEERPRDYGLNYMISVDSSQNVYVLGNTRMIETEDDPPPGGEFVAKYSPTGELLWDIETTAVNGMTIDAEDNLYLFEPAGNDIFHPWLRLSKYSPDGELLWERIVEVTLTKNDEYRYIWDEEGNLYVVDQHEVTLFDADGNLLWQRRADDTPDDDPAGPAGPAEFALFSIRDMLVLDLQGNTVARFKAEDLGLTDVTQMLLADNLLVIGSDANRQTVARFLRQTANGYEWDSSRDWEIGKDFGVRAARDGTGGFCVATSSDDDSKGWLYYLDSDLNPVWDTQFADNLLLWEIFGGSSYEAPRVRADTNGCIVQYNDDEVSSRVARYRASDGKRTDALVQSYFFNMNFEVHDGYVIQAGGKISFSIVGQPLRVRAAVSRHRIY